MITHTCIKIVFVMYRSFQYLNILYKPKVHKTKHGKPTMFSYAAAFLAIWVLLRLCFLANFMLRTKLGSIPLSLCFCLVEGFLVGLRWFFLVWLCAVWFLDFAILNDNFPQNFKFYFLTFRLEQGKFWKGRTFRVITLTLKI